MNWVDFVKTYTPLIVTLVPKLIPLSGIIASAIVEAQAIKSARGDEKLGHVLKVVNKAIEGINELAGKVIVEPSVVNDGLIHTINIIVALANSQKGK